MTILSRFLVHVSISELLPLFEYRHTEVNCDIYDIGAPAFSIISQSGVGACTKKYDYTIITCTLLLAKNLRTNILTRTILKHV